jgi:hypothetical protein
MRWKRKRKKRLRPRKKSKSIEPIARWHLLEFDGFVAKSGVIVLGKDNDFRVGGLAPSIIGFLRLFLLYPTFRNRAEFDLILSLF